MRTPALLALLLVLPLFRSYPQAPPTPPDQQPPGTPPAPAPQGPQSGRQTAPLDARKNWAVAFTSLTGEGLTPDESYLAFSVPLLLKDRVSALSDHSFPPEELAAYQKSVIIKELRGLYQGLAQLRQQRDESLFAVPQDPKAVADSEKRLSDALERIHWLEALDPAEIKVEKAKPVQFKEGTGVGKLFDAPQYSLYQYALEQDADLLIGGTVRQIEGYILVDLWAYEPVQEQTVYTFRDAAQPERIYESLGEAAKGLVGVILGRQWASLTLVPDPPDSLTTIDGKSMGAGRVQSAYLEPGAREIRVSAPGYKEEVRTVDLAPLEEQTLSIQLEKENRPNLTLSTNPPGADVYLDSIWIGKTPLTLELPAERTRVQLGLAGFYDVPFSIGPSSPPQLSFDLQKDIGSLQEFQKKARDDFYTAFGFFLLSLPIPFFSYTFSASYARAYAQQPAGSTAAQNSVNTYYIFYYSYFAGIGLSASLATWMIIDLIHYITVANRTAG